MIKKIEYDFIGDIHGYADELHRLLLDLGYNKVNGTYQQEHHKVIFVGDYIDRGPKILETLQIVKSMVEAGHAIALMGNHEFNALCYHTKLADGTYLRPHSDSNVKQHKETMFQFDGNTALWETYLKWFLTLPLFWETSDFRVVHACWDFPQIEFLKLNLTNGCLTEKLLLEAGTTGNLLFDAVEIVLKGKELRLPNGIGFTDVEGHTRYNIRIKWWENPVGLTYRDYAVTEVENLPNIAISDLTEEYYPEAELPVFFGHYWLIGLPKKRRSNVICLDFSVAKNGILAAYRWGAEKWFYSAVGEL